MLSACHLRLQGWLQLSNSPALPCLGLFHIETIIQIFTLTYHTALIHIEKCFQIYIWYWGLFHIGTMISHIRMSLWVLSYWSNAFRYSWNKSHWGLLHIETLISCFQILIHILRRDLFHIENMNSDIHYHITLFHSETIISNISSHIYLRYISRWNNDLRYSMTYLGLFHIKTMISDMYSYFLDLFHIETIISNLHMWHWDLLRTETMISDFHDHIALGFDSHWNNDWRHSCSFHTMLGFIMKSKTHHETIQLLQLFNKTINNHTYITINKDHWKYQCHVWVRYWWIKDLLSKYIKGKS